MSSASPSRVEQPVLIVFADLTRFMVNSRATPDAALADLVDRYYRHAEGLVSAAGGVEALPALKRDIDAWWAGKGWDSRVVLKAHFGRAVVGPFGADARFDVIGNEVNVAATLPARTVSLSAEAFRCLEAGSRRAFKKHTEPVVYIPVDDPRP
jgi:class 3 adenylate cyclase